MNTSFVEQTWHLLGWTMLHFLWLGTALLLVTAVVRRALRRAGPNVRYTHSLATLLALAALPPATATWLSGSPPPSAGEGLGEGAESLAVRGSPDPALLATEGLPPTSQQFIELNPDYIPPTEPLIPPPPSAGEGEILARDFPTLAGATGSASAHPTSPTDTGKASVTLDRALAFIRILVPYLPYLWLLGTPITFALLATGLVGAERMRRHGAPLIDGPVHEACQRLRRSLRITRDVALAVCDRVTQPVLVGIVRPLILLPPVALTGWSPEELEMVLLHELAHVRRWDNLVNLAQRVIESLLFFHPAVWITSTWVRRDREECCDAVVVTRTAQPKQYAELLVSLASAPQPLAGPLLASTALARHPLAGRLRRILKLEDEPMLVSRNTIGLLALAVVAIALVVVSGPLRVQGENQPSEDSGATDPPPPSAGEGLGEGAIPDKTEPLTSTNASNESTSAVESPKDRFTSIYQFDEDVKADLEKLLDVVEFGKDASVKIAGEEYLVIAAPAEEHDRLARVFERYLGDKGTKVQGPQRIKEDNKSTEWNSYPPAGFEFLAEAVAPEAPRATEKTTAVYEIPQDRYDPPPPSAGETENSGTQPHIPPSEPAANARPAVLQSAPTDRIVMAHEIPQEFQNLVDRWAKAASIHGLWDERGRFVMQATLGQHDQLKSLIDASQQWRDEPAVQQRRSATIAIREVDGQARLEWPNLGLTFQREMRQESPPTMGLGGAEVIEGIKVVEVAPGSPAAWQDVQHGDVLKSVDGFRTTSLTELSSVINSLLQGFERNKGLELHFLRPAGEGRGVSHLPRRFPLRPDEAEATITDPRGRTPFRGEVTTTPFRPQPLNLPPLPFPSTAPKEPDQPQPANMTKQPVPTPALAPPPPTASPEELKVLREHIKFIEEQYKRIDALFQEGARGGSAEKRDLVAYELSLAQGELALAEGRLNEALAKFEAARMNAEEALKTARLAYENDFVSYDFLLQAAKNLAEIKRKIIQLQPSQAPRAETPELPVQPAQPPLPFPSPPPREPTTPQPTRPSREPTPATAPDWPVSPPTDRYERAPSQTNGESFRSVPPVSPPMIPPPSPDRPADRYATGETPAKSVYRYDGKTFQQWQDLWKHELSTERRIEAVKALAAFGRVGYGKEAAEAILDVAGEYEFQTMDSTLRDEITAAFANQIQFGDWQSLLRKRYEADPTKWESAAANVFRSLKPKNDEDRQLRQQFLLHIAKHGTQAKRLAFQSLMHADPGLNDAEIKQLALDGLKSDDPPFYSSAMSAFSHTGIYPPEYVDILLHDASGKQPSARNWLRRSNEKSRLLVDKLLEIVNDQEQAADHLAAIRALGAIGKAALAASPGLVQIIKDSDDPKLKVAAVVALNEIEPQNQGRTLLLDGVTGDEQAKLIDQMNEEFRAVHAPSQ